jgi:transaldolase/glucose-6-phosphate isomerase
MMPVENRLRALQVFGQSAWLDYIRRSLLTSGELRRLIDEDGLQGLTSNPAIFEKAIVGSADYDDILRGPDARGLAAKTLYEKLAIRDIRDAADALRPVYQRTSARDGYVSLEVSPILAHDTAGTLAEARRLWREVARANLMIKVPATNAGLRAIRELIGEGINVNVTLLFGCDTYEKVAQAYMAGVEALSARGGDPARVGSVASFFVSRVDSAIDSLLEARAAATIDAKQKDALRGLMGRAAIANAKLAYQRYRQLVGSASWQALARQGAQTQRLLWASTGTKNPNYRDVVYVEELIGAETVNTMPPATLEAFRDHGRPRASLTDDLESAHHTMQRLEGLGISMQEVAERLLAEGLQLFSDAFAKLLEAVERRAQG